MTSFEVKLLQPDGLLSILIKELEISISIGREFDTTREAVFKIVFHIGRAVLKSTDPISAEGDTAVISNWIASLIFIAGWEICFSIDEVNQNFIENREIFRLIVDGEGFPLNTSLCMWVRDSWAARAMSKEIKQIFIINY